LMEMINVWKQSDNVKTNVPKEKLLEIINDKSSSKNRAQYFKTEANRMSKMNPV